MQSKFFENFSLYLKEPWLVLWAGLALAFVYMVRYIYLHGADDYEKALGPMVLVFLAGASVIGAIRVIYFSFYIKTCDITVVEQIYVTIGGAVIFFASVFDAYNRIKKA